MALIRYIRGTYVEVLLFAALPVVLIIDGSRPRRPGSGRRLPSRPLLAVIGVAVGIPLPIAPRYAPPLAVIIAAAGAAALVLAWPDAGASVRRNPEPGPGQLGRGVPGGCAFEVLSHPPSRYAAAAQPAFHAVSDQVGRLA